jgi:hypothetical protein
MPRAALWQPKPTWYTPSMRASPLFLFACACGAATTVPPIPPSLPTVAGRAVYDVPLEDAPPRVRAAWEGANRLFDDPAPEDPAERVRWMQTRASALSGLEDALLPLMEGEPRDRVFAAVLMAALLDDLYEQTRELPALVEDAAVRAEFHEVVAVFGMAARGQYLRCTESIEAAPEPQRAWTDHCRERAEQLMVVSQPAEAPPSPLAACESEESYTDPEAPEPDPSAPSEIAILYAGDRFTGRARTRLLGAIRTRLDALEEDSVIPIDEVEDAERLVQARRWTEDGPACGQAPPLPAILAQRHRNLRLAIVDTSCNDGGSDCTLSVYLRRAASDDAGSFLAATVVGSAASLTNWTRAAGALDARGGLSGTGSDQPPLQGNVFRVRGTTDDDPWLRLGPTLRWAEQDRFLECAQPGGVGLYDVTLHVEANGTVSASTVRAAVPPSSGDADAVARCLEERLRAVSLPCPRSGSAVDAQIRICLGRE